MPDREKEARATTKLKTGRWLPLVIMLAMPAALLLLSRLLQAQAGGFSLGHFWAEYLLLLAPAALLWAATGRAWCAWLIEGLPLMLLTLISYYKQRVNGIPLLPGDFALFGNAGDILGFAAPQLGLTFVTFLLLLLWIAALWALVSFRERLRAGKRLRLAALGVGVLLALLLIFRVLAPNSYEGGGVALRLYTLWASSASESAKVDEGVRSDLREQLSATPTPTPAPTPAAPEATPEPEPVIPSVIFLMSESFFDVTRLPGVEYEGDPLPHFHALQGEGSGGLFLSQTYCGGTGYVEMEVLTGLCSNFLRGADTLTSLPEEVYPNIPCITDVFAEQGYYMTFLHAYNDSLYNRSLIYPALGFDSVRFAETFPEGAEMAGGYLSDMVLTAEILSQLDAREGPQLIFAVSMENHQPYSAEKYGEAAAISPVSDLLSETELQVLDAYVHGAENADAALGALADALREREEPVLLVFWGDHLPNLGLADGSNIYADLGFCDGTDTEAWGAEELQRMLCTDYVLWSNYGLETSEGMESSTFLGLHVLEKLGYPLTDYYAWLRDYVDGQVLMSRPRLFTDGAGRAYSAVPEEQRDLMLLWRAAVTDAVYEGQYFTKYRSPASGPEWERPALIAHAGGAVDGYRLTNSLEALETAYAGGFRYMELDFSRTSDGGIVLLHDWESMAERLLGAPGIRTREEFLAAPALAGLTLLDLEGLLNWLRTHEEVSIVTDVKAENNLAFLQEIYYAAGDLAGRFIPQAYSFREAEVLRRAGWERVILTLYRMETGPGALSAFLAENPLWAVVIPAEDLTPELAAAVKDSGAPLYCHTVNSVDFVDEWREYLTGIYTDYFVPESWVY